MSYTGDSFSGFNVSPAFPVSVSSASQVDPDPPGVLAGDPAPLSAGLGRLERCCCGGHSVVSGPPRGAVAPWCGAAGAAVEAGAGAHAVDDAGGWCPCPVGGADAGEDRPCWTGRIQIALIYSPLSALIQGRGCCEDSTGGSG